MYTVDTTKYDMKTNLDWPIAPHLPGLDFGIEAVMHLLKLWRNGHATVIKRLHKVRRIRFLLWSRQTDKQTDALDKQQYR